MATISRVGPVCHLRAQPNQYILHFKKGRLVRQGAGLAYWFGPLSAAVAEVPVEDIETTFLVHERTGDFQESAVQCTLTYRFSDPVRAAARVNFAVSLVTGLWVDKPLEKMAGLWAQRSRPAIRAYLAGVPITDAVRVGPEMISRALEGTLRGDAELAGMGVGLGGGGGGLVSVQVNQVAAAPELEKALTTPTREALQQKADEAVFARRALAVEKERAIKENELATQIELARRQEELIGREGANRLLEVRSAAEAERARVEAEVARQALATEGYARDVRLRAEGDADAKRAMSAAEIEAEARKVEMWKGVPAEVVMGLAARELAGKLERVNHLNITPDLVGDGLTRILRRQAER